MLVLIAESKTMAACDAAVAKPQRPELWPLANAIMNGLRGMTVQQLAEATGLSPAMAQRLYRMVYDFPSAATGSAAIESYTGVVFRALDYPTLPAEAKERARSQVRIISSLYGYLRPQDTVKPYRLDFTTRVAPDGRTLAAYYRDAVTHCLNEDLRAAECPDIINLLPKDAERCIDFGRTGAHVWRVDFKSRMPDGTLRTPSANQLKTLRGLLLRQILTDPLATPDQLKALASAVGDDGTLTFEI